MAVKSLSFALCIVFCASAHAAGFAIGEQGAHASGMGGAVTARHDSPDAGSFNPAAWATKEGLLLNLGAAFIAPTIQHTHPSTNITTTANAGPATPPYGQVGYGFGSVAVGVAFRVPFGSGLTWPGDDWSGRYQLRSIALQTFEFAPVVAYQPIEGLSFAVGPRALWSTVSLTRNIDVLNPSQDGTVELGGNGLGWGMHAAIAAGPFGPLRFGLTYRSRSHIGYTGAARFDDIPIELGEPTRDGGVQTAIHLPDRIALGAALQLDDLHISVDLEYYTWSTFDRLSVRFENKDTPELDDPRNWHNTLALRAGVEYANVLGALRLRVGFVYDPSPSPSNTLSPSSPDSTRLMVTAGASYPVFASISVHAAYGFVHLLGADATGDAFPGRYDGRAHVASLGVSSGF